jgi:hypothetical protein
MASQPKVDKAVVAHQQQARCGIETMPERTTRKRNEVRLKMQCREGQFNRFSSISKEKEKSRGKF